MVGISFGFQAETIWRLELGLFFKSSITWASWSTPSKSLHCLPYTGPRSPYSFAKELSFFTRSINSCNSGDFFVDYFGCKKTDIKNFFLGWSLADYSFEKYKSKKKRKNDSKIRKSQRFAAICKSLLENLQNSEQPAS